MYLEKKGIFLNTKRLCLSALNAQRLQDNLIDCPSFDFWIEYLYSSESKPGTYEAVSPQLMMCQVIATLEVLHPILGWIKSSPTAAFMQVGRSSLYVSCTCNITSLCCLSSLCVCTETSCFTKKFFSDYFSASSYSRQNLCKHLQF